MNVADTCNSRPIGETHTEAGELFCDKKQNKTKHPNYNLVNNDFYFKAIVSHSRSHKN